MGEKKKKGKWNIESTVLKSGLKRLLVERGQVEHTPQKKPRSPGSWLKKKPQRVNKKKQHHHQKKKKKNGNKKREKQI